MPDQSRLSQISRSDGGMPKYAVEGGVWVGPDGVEGDRHRNVKLHGGPYKAVLMIAREVLLELVRRGYPVYPGALGENLTVEGMDPRLWRAGQRICVGAQVVIELTTLREPCANLNVYGPSIKSEIWDGECRRGDPVSARWAFGGFYARVVQPGFVTAGDRVVPDRLDL